MGVSDSLAHRSDAMTMTATKPTTAREAGRPWPLLEAAEYLNVSTRTLTRLAEADQLRLVRLGLGRGRVLVPDSEVRRLAEGT
jgi:excisionase family DNA binding protein